VTVTIRRLLAVVLWLLLGHVALGGAYWLLLNVPESNVLALSTSFALALVLVIGACLVDVTALLWLRPDWRWRAALLRSVRVLPVFIIALVVWVAIYWIVTAMELRYEARTGEVDAWLIAKFNWTRTAWLHRTLSYVFEALRWVLSTSVAVALLTFAAVDGFAEIFRLRWLWRALSPGQLVIITVAVVGLFWLPWQYIYWRPAAIPPNTVELLFNGAKLFIVAFLINLGIALVLWAPQRRPLR
jgi:hypothetical protein